VTFRRKVTVGLWCSAALLAVEVVMLIGQLNFGFEGRAWLTGIAVGALAEAVAFQAAFLYVDAVTVNG